MLRRQYLGPVSSFVHPCASATDSSGAYLADRETEIAAEARPGCFKLPLNPFREAVAGETGAHS